MVMVRHFENLTRQASRAIRYWWMMLLAGLLCVAAGIMVFVYPLESYMTLALVLGFIILFVGVSQFIISGISGNYMMMKGYIIVGSVLDIIIGLFLCLNPAITLVVIPVICGLWLMYHSFIIISLGGDMSTFLIPGDVVVTVGGILLLVLSVFVLIKPFDIGVDAVISITGIGFIMLGLVLSAISVTLRDIHRILD